MVYALWTLIIDLKYVRGYQWKPIANMIVNDEGPNDILLKSGTKQSVILFMFLFYTTIEFLGWASWKPHSLELKKKQSWKKKK